MKCLVTNLQGVVSDDSLMKIGEMRLRIKTDKLTSAITIVRYYVEGVPPFVIKTLDGSAKMSTNANGTDLVSEIDFTQNMSKNAAVYFAPGEYEVSIVSKSGIGALICHAASGLGIDAQQVARMPYLKALTWINPSYEFDISHLREMPMMETFSCQGEKVIGNLYGLTKVKNIKTELSLNATMVADDVARLSKVNVGKKITLQNSLGLYGDIMSAVSHNTELEYLSLTRSTNLSGNLSSIRGLKKLNTLNINIANIEGNVADLGYLASLTTFAGADNPHLSGTLESMVTTFRANGRASGTIALPMATYMKNVTFNGMLLREYSNANLGGKNDIVVTWTSDTITLS